MDVPAHTGSQTGRGAQYGCQPQMWQLEKDQDGKWDDMLSLQDTIS